MDEIKMIDRMLTGLSERDLSEVLLALGRRIVAKRQSKDATTVFTMLTKIAKWLDGVVPLNAEEKSLLTEPQPEGINGRIRAIKCYRERTGMRLIQAKNVIDAWVVKNITDPSKQLSLLGADAGSGL